MKTKEVKRNEAEKRNVIQSAQFRLENLNNNKRRATKERARLSKYLSITVDDTYGYDFDGSKIHRELCIY